MRIAKWSGEWADDLEARRNQLEQTLRKLVRKRVDVAAVINTLDAARWRYVEYRLRRRIGRLVPTLPPMCRRSDNNPFHQELLTKVRTTLKRLGVSGPDVTSLIRDTGLRDLTGANRPDPPSPSRQ